MLDKPMAKASGIIALLTDYGLADPYAGIVKGAILTVNPEARIIDLCHGVAPQNITEGSRILSSALPYFPSGTLFVAIVDPGVGTDRAVVGVETDRHFFLAPDNGLLGFLDREYPIRRIIHIRERRYFLRPPSNTFHGRDIFAPVAGHLSRGIDLSRFGPAADALVAGEHPGPRVGRNGAVQGEVVAIDRFGNLITNIPARILAGRRPFRVHVGRKVVRKLSQTYAEGRKGDLLALVGSTGHLEISVNCGSALETIRAHKGDRVVVTRGAL